MSDDNKKLARRWFDEVWNKGRREAIDEMMPADCILHDGETVLKGPEGFKPFFDWIHGMLSDSRIEILETMADGDLVCMRWLVTARHTGDNLGVPATGKQVRCTGISMIRFAHGAIVEAWQNWDALGLVTQIRGDGGGAMSAALGTRP